MLVWLDLLLSANTVDRWERGFKVKRGEVLTSTNIIQQRTGLSPNTIKKAIAILEESGEVKRDATKAGTKYIIRQFNKYQSSSKIDQPTDQPTDQLNKNIRINNSRIQEDINTPTPARAREAKIGEEAFGTFANVFLKPAEHRAIIQEFGQEAVDATIEDLSCKLADGTTDSTNHYATLLYWLNYQRYHGRKPVKDDDRTPHYVPINWEK